MQTLQNIDDRLIMVALTLIVLGGYAATRDPLFGEMSKYMIGATAGIMVARTTRTLNVGSGPETAKVVDEFLNKR